MAQIDTSAEGLLRMIGRLTREYGETAASNFALDEQLNRALVQLQDLTAQNAVKDAALADLKAQVASMGAQLDTLRMAADPDPSHAHRYTRANRKPRKVA